MGLFVVKFSCLKVDSDNHNCELNFLSLQKLLVEVTNHAIKIKMHTMNKIMHVDGNSNFERYSHATFSSLK